MRVTSYTVAIGRGTSMAEKRQERIQRSWFPYCFLREFSAKLSSQWDRNHDPSEIHLRVKPCARVRHGPALVRLPKLPKCQLFFRLASAGSCVACGVVTQRNAGFLRIDVDAAVFELACQAGVIGSSVQRVYLVHPIGLRVTKEKMRTLIFPGEPCKPARQVKPGRSG